MRLRATSRDEENDFGFPKSNEREDRSGLKESRHCVSSGIPDFSADPREKEKEMRVNQVVVGSALLLMAIGFSGAQVVRAEGGSNTGNGTGPGSVTAVGPGEEVIQWCRGNRALLERVQRL